MPDAAGYRAALKANDRHYEWKMGLRILLLVLNIAMIAMAGWATAGAIVDYNFNLDDYYVWDYELVPWVLIPMGLSFIYAVVVLAYQSAKRRPVHPGWNVGVDLILWLSFAILGSFELLAALDIISDFSSNSNFEDTTGYITASNGTEVYLNPDNTASCPAFTSCAAQDAYIKKVYDRGVVEIAIFALMMFAVLLHFTLFVWACVDTADHNAHKTSRGAKELAQVMIAEMVANGQIPPPQQPLLFQTPSQRSGQMGHKSISHEYTQAMMAPPNQPPMQQTGHGYYAPVPQQPPNPPNPPNASSSTQQLPAAWPLTQSQPLMNENQAPLQANMPPPPRQQYLTAAQVRPKPIAPHQHLPPLPAVSPISPIGRAESPTIPGAVAARDTPGLDSVSGAPVESPATAGAYANANGKGKAPIYGYFSSPTRTEKLSTASSEALGDGPSVPARAPGHTVSPKSSNTSVNYYGRV